MLMLDPSLLGKRVNVWLEVSSPVDIFLKYGESSFDIQEQSRIMALVSTGEIKSFFNSGFFTETDSREPESAGIAASLKGSLLVMIIFLFFAFPIGVMRKDY